MHDLVDIGANLTNRVFHRDLPGVLARARAAGVGTIVVTGTSVEVSTDAAALAGAHGLYATAGIHPHHAKDAGDDFTDRLVELLRDPRVVAIGECGLDYNRMFSPRDVQLRVFEAQLALAASTGKPVFLHERDAADDFVAVLREHRKHLAAAVVHCFTGTGETLARYLDLNLHVGMTGWICDERRGVHLRELVGAIPRDRLMIETDAPYLLPRTLVSAPKDRRNEPAFLPAVLEAVAAATRRKAEEVARETTATARAFFGITTANHTP